MQTKKIKVAWLCNFANKEVAELLDQDININIAPWITSLIDLFRKQQDIELHVVAPNYYANEYKRLELDNINLYLFPYRPFYVPQKLLNFSLGNFTKSRRSEKKILEAIQPDIIHLFGTENPMYAYGALDFINKIPILVSIQGYVFMSSPTRNIIKKFIRRKRIRCEQKINSKASFFTINNPDSINIIKKFNKEAKIYRSYYPTMVPKESFFANKNKVYNIIYCAKITREKGIEDLIEAVKIIREKMHKIRVIIVGSGSESYVHYIQALVEKYSLKENFTFKGFISDHSKIFELIACSDVFVLPTYFDNFPGSIREAMLMKVPVVSYDIEGISFINEKSECIALVEKRNIQNLADRILELLSNKEKADYLVSNAFELMTTRYSNKAIYANLISIYEDILYN